MTVNKVLLSMAAIFLIVLPCSHAGLALDKASAADGPCGSGDTAAEPTAGALTLSQARELALARNPELKASCIRIDSARAGRRQERLFINPELEFEMEEFGGTGEFEEGDFRESTILLSQQIEFGGKYKNRGDVASGEVEITLREHELKKRALAAEVERLFHRVLAAQERVSLAEEAVANAEEVHRAVSEKVRAGKVAAVEKEKSAIVLSNAKIVAGRARRELLSARMDLAASWDSSDPRFDEARGDIYETTPPPAFEQLLDAAGVTPDMYLWEAEIEKREAQLALAESGAVPDVTVGFGLKTYEETDDTSYVAELSVPIPLFDRNQGGREEAGHRLLEARQKKRVIETESAKSLYRAWHESWSAYESVSAIENEVLPGAEKVYESVRLGYRAGKFDYLELLDAQERLFEIREERLSALLDYHESRIMLEYLTGVKWAGSTEPEEQLFGGDENAEN